MTPDGWLLGGGGGGGAVNNPGGGGGTPARKIKKFFINEQIRINKVTQSKQAHLNKTSTNHTFQSEIFGQQE